jgi:hypothetical protein
VVSSAHRRGKRIVAKGWATRQGGRKAVESALKSYEKLLAAHEADLANYQAAGGYTSSVESEIDNFKGLIQAAKDWLSKDP